LEKVHFPEHSLFNNRRTLLPSFRVFLEISVSFKRQPSKSIYEPESFISRGPLVIHELSDSLLGCFGLKWQTVGFR